MHARKLTIVGLVAAWGLLATACGSDGPSPVDPSAVLPSLSVAIDTASIAFHLSPGDSVEADWQEQYHVWATGRLGVTLTARVQYYKYSSDAQMRSLTGRGCCFAEPERLTVHTTYTRDNHEVVHLYSARIGTPSNFFNEGLAVAFQTNPAAGDFEPRWNGTPLHSLARSFLEQGSLPSLGSMVETEDFRRLPSEISYPAAGSLMQYLIEQHGIDSVRGLFQGGGGPTESRQQIDANFRAAIGRSLEDAEGAWHARLRLSDGALSRRHQQTGAALEGCFARPSRSVEGRHRDRRRPGVPILRAWPLAGCSARDRPRGADRALPSQTDDIGPMRLAAHLVRRVYETDQLVCPRCGAEMRPAVAHIA